MSQQTDGIEVTATMKSLAEHLHCDIGKREATPDEIHYYYMRHVDDLFQFARVAATITKLQVILDTLQRAKDTLEQKEDADRLLRDVWRLMQKIVSQEAIEKIAACKIELRRDGVDPIIVSEADMWKQANSILQEWSIPANQDQRVEYVITYPDGYRDGRWLKLPSFYTLFSEERQMLGPVPDLGERIIGSLKKSLDLGSEHQASFDAAREAALTYLRRYEVGGRACVEAVTEAIIKIQNEQWSPNIVYRRSLHSEHNQRDGSL